VPYAEKGRKKEEVVALFWLKGGGGNGRRKKRKKKNEGRKGRGEVCSLSVPFRKWGKGRIAKDRIVAKEGRKKTRLLF